MERARFIPYNPSNGWGNYTHLVEFVQEYFDGCIKFPDADIEISR